MPYPAGGGLFVLPKTVASACDTGRGLLPMAGCGTGNVGAPAAGTTQREDAATMLNDATSETTPKRMANSPADTDRLAVARTGASTITISYRRLHRLAFVLAAANTIMVVVRALTGDTTGMTLHAVGAILSLVAVLWVQRFHPRRRPAVAAAHLPTIGTRLQREPRSD